MSKRIVPKLCAAGMLYLAAFPLFLLPAALLVPDRVWLGALLPAPALLLTGAAGLLPAKRRAAAFLSGILLMAAGCVFLFVQSSQPAMLLFLPCLLAMLLFMPAMARPAHQEWTASRLGTGVLLHLAAQFMKGLPVFAGAAAALGIGFAAYLTACLFSLNRIVLTDLSPSAVKPLLAKNRGLLTIVCLLALLLSNLQAVAAAIRAAVSWTVLGVMQVFNWIASLLPNGSQPPGDGGAANFSDLAETAEPGLFAKIMEIALTVFGTLILAALLFLAFRRLVRVLRKLLQTALARLNAYRRRISADYVDQSESLLHWNEIKRVAAARIHRIRRRVLPVPWEKLSPAQRVRRVYALLLRRGGTPDPALTAREALQSGALKLPPDAAAVLAALYDRARYSTHPIKEQEADNLRKRAGV